MNGSWILLSVGISFFVTALLGKKMIPYLRKLKYGQTILKDGPSWHKGKQGTPTIGGLMFIIGIVLAILICIPVYYFSSTKKLFEVAETPVMVSMIFSGLSMAIGFGIIGFIDDYIKVVKKRNLGLTARQKLILQFCAAAIYLLTVYITKSMNGSTHITTTTIPFLGSINLGVFYWPIMAVVIVGFVNATNLTDGIDGLNASVTFFAALIMMIVTAYRSMTGLSISSAALAGGCLGFLVWNYHPAKIFMGDTGSLFLGGMLCALFFGCDMPILMLTVGLVYILEMLSVMWQVFYFKITHGKRFFKMSPIHHHFELRGWSESKICIVFSLVEVLLGIVTLAIVIYSRC